MTLIDRLQKLAQLWTDANDRSLSRLATVVANDGKLFERLGKGASCTVATYERFLAFFRDEANWPGGAIPGEVHELLASAVLVGVVHADADTPAEQTAAPCKNADRTGSPERSVA